MENEEVAFDFYSEIRDWLGSPEGRLRLTNALNTSIEDSVQRHGLTRRIARTFKEQYIFENHAGNQNCIPTFEIKAGLVLEGLSPDRYDIFVRGVNMLVSDIARQEDEFFFRLAQASADAAQEGVTDGLVPLVGTTGLGDFIKPMQDKGVVVTHIILSPLDYAKYFRNTTGLHWETRRELLKLGVMGYFEGATVMQSRKVPVGLPHVFGSRTEAQIAERPNLFDLLLTERKSPVLAIEEGGEFPTLTLTEEVGIGVSGKFVQQIVLPGVEATQD